jgi:uncharacterized membrane protein
MSRKGLAVLLLCGYTVFAHVGATSGRLDFAWIAWLCLVAVVALALPAKPRLAVCVALIAPLLWLDIETLLRLPPVVVNLALAAWFGKSLRPGEEPVISWFARLDRGELVPELAAYSRRLTAIWTVFFVIMALLCALLAVFADAETWSIFANGISYVLIGSLFVGEYVYRRVRYRHYSHTSLPHQISMMLKAGGTAPRRVGRR